MQGGGGIMRWEGQMGFGRPWDWVKLTFPRRFEKRRWTWQRSASAPGPSHPTSDVTGDGADDDSDPGRDGVCLLWLSLQRLKDRKFQSLPGAFRCDFSSFERGDVPHSVSVTLAKGTDEQRVAHRELPWWIRSRPSTGSSRQGQGRGDASRRWRSPACGRGNVQQSFGCG